MSRKASAGMSGWRIMLCGSPISSSRSKPLAAMKAGLQ
jgi:hypothetical protein